MTLTRRTFLASLAAAPSFAQPASPYFRAFDTARQIEQLHSLVIAQHGQIIAAEAFRGPALDRPVNVKSVSKSIISALTGIAIQRGELSGPDQLIAPLLGRSIPRRADKRVRDITVGHMLSMQSGLQEVSGAAYGSWVNTKHWIYEALSKPMIADPGTAMLYSTASYHVLGALLAAVAGQNLHQIAQSRLGEPLQIDIPAWNTDPQGRYVGGNDMRISPLGMLKFGEMYRNSGTYKGTRILSKNWIDQSWDVYGNSSETFHGYGFGWFIWPTPLHDVFYARGYGGQMIYIVVDLALSVAITSDPSRPATLDGHLGALNALLIDHIIPATPVPV